MGNLSSNEMNVLMNAVGGFARRRDSNQRQQQIDQQSELQKQMMALRERDDVRADKRLDLSERELQDRTMSRNVNRFQQMGQQAIAGAAQTSKPTVFDETLRLTKDYQSKQKEIERSMVEARMQGDQQGVADLQGQMQALQAQGQMLQEKAQENGTTEPLVEVQMDGPRGEKFKTKVPYSKLAEFGFEMPYAGGDQSGEEIPDARKLRQEELRQELVALEQERASKMSDVGKFNLRDIFQFDGLPFGAFVDSDEEKVARLGKESAKIREELGGGDLDLQAKSQPSPEDVKMEIRKRFNAGELTEEQARKALEGLKNGG